MSGESNNPMIKRRSSSSLLDDAFDHHNSDDEPGLRSKMKHLIGEFQKLKGERSLLKKAVLSEKKKNEELETEVSELKRENRIYVGEIDTLKFNIQNLQKRCAKLMDQLKHSRQEMNKRSGHSSLLGSLLAGPGTSQEQVQLSEQLKVMEEELQNKIQDNGRLNLQVHTLEREHETALETMQKKLEDLKASLAERSSELERSRSNTEALTDQLKNERAASQLRTEELIDELRRHRLQSTQRETDMTQINQQVTNDLRLIQGRFFEKVSFDDSSNEEIDTLNLESLDRASLIDKVELTEDSVRIFSKLGGHVHVLVHAVLGKMKVESQSDQIASQCRKDIMNAALKVMNSLGPDLEDRFDTIHRYLSELAQDLKQQANYSSDRAHRPLPSPRSSSSSKETIFSELGSFLDSCSRFVVVQLDLLEERKRVLGSSKSAGYTQIGFLLEAYGVLHQLLVDGALFMQRLHNAVEGKVNISETLSLHCNRALDALLTMDTEYVQNIRRSLANISSRFAAKVTFDHRAPFTSSAVREFNNSIVGEMTTISNLVGKLASRLDQFRDLRTQTRSSVGFNRPHSLLNGVGAAGEGHGGVLGLSGDAVISTLSSPSKDARLLTLRRMQNRTQRYMSALSDDGTDTVYPPSFPSVSYYEAVGNKKEIIRLSGEIESLNAHSASLEARIEEMKKERAALEDIHRSELQERSERLKELDTEVKSLRSQVEDLNVDVEELRETVSEREEELNLTIGRAEEAERSVFEAKQRMEKATAVNETLKTRLGESMKAREVAEQRTKAAIEAANRAKSAAKAMEAAIKKEKEKREREKQESAKVAATKTDVDTSPASTEDDSEPPSKPQPSVDAAKLPGSSNSAAVAEKAPEDTSSKATPSPQNANLKNGEKAVVVDSGKEQEVERPQKEENENKDNTEKATEDEDSFGFSEDPFAALNSSSNAADPSTSAADSVQNNATVDNAVDGANPAPSSTQPDSLFDFFGGNDDSASTQPPPVTRSDSHDILGLDDVFGGSTVSTTNHNTDQTPPTTSPTSAGEEHSIDPSDPFAALSIGSSSAQPTSTTAVSSDPFDAFGTFGGDAVSASNPHTSQEQHVPALSPSSSSLVDDEGVIGTPPSSSPVSRSASTTKPHDDNEVAGAAPSTTSASSRRAANDSWLSRKGKSSSGGSALAGTEVTTVSEATGPFYSITACEGGSLKAYGVSVGGESVTAATFQGQQSSESIPITLQLRNHLEEMRRTQMEKDIYELRAALTLTERRMIECQYRLDITTRRLDVMTTRCKASEEDAQRAHYQVTKLKDDLKATKENYEKMMGELTEHVCQLTEKLAQADAQREKMIAKRKKQMMEQQRAEQEKQKNASWW